MTPHDLDIAIAFTVGVFLGAATIFTYMTHLWIRERDEHHYRRIHLGAVRTRVLYDTADHEHRLRVRMERENTRLRAIVNDLYDRLTTRQPAPAGTARHSPMIRNYGRWRNA